MLNAKTSEIVVGRLEANTLMTKKLKEIFAQNETPIKSITFSEDSTVITIYIEGNAESFIHFTKSFLNQLGMPFTVRRDLDEKCNHRLYLELYPLMDEEGS